jgi:hypothetical protein
MGIDGFATAHRLSADMRFNPIRESSFVFTF